MTEDKNTAQEISPILRLPAELRLQICAYVLTSPLPLTIHCWRRYAPFSFATRILQHPPSFLSLLLTCRQIYAKTQLLPFQLNNFRFKSQDAFLPWLEQLGEENVQALRQVELVTWMARHMIEGENWVAKRVEECFPIRKLGGLRIVRVEVRMNGRMRDCLRGECWNCERYGACIREEEERLRNWFKDMTPGIEVVFGRVAA